MNGRRDVKLKGCEPVAARIAELMEDGIERTVKECSDALNRSRKTVQGALHELSQEGPLQQVHVCRQDGKSLVYVNGPGKNVAVKTWRDPARTGRAARCAGSAQIDTPMQPSDDVLVECMRRMVCCGTTTPMQQRIAA